MRLIHRMVAIRVCTLLLGFSVCLPVMVESATKGTTRTTTSKKRVAPAGKRPVYSASASKARKARLARARAAARKREL